ncbi:probable RNA 3'-terminal phosphate cyclase-like protein [Tribolium castaneum]|uniref:Putative RNA 3'-terminal phosphate cyclase-like protein n=1 Tax=Tribolium castaneum TaxID=7070 RepID=D6WH43_TRICA|nr:PREDICTED: probable RNA 3'-terminal phosphate cyclase-like protein [Tribolium castaneum]EEZ99757.1 putative RNA 3'-terminal phosphate cyclase-like protein [Tribolium castaneum]|eukprot:XP_967971.1 PREDICTED: probable RNA 3'-terminal phosphate cyclase-like protein [Tribolium castaneum]
MTTATDKGSVLCYKGSNFFRQRLVLSILSGKPVRITHIRVLEDEPGLREFEVNLIRLLDKITNGSVIELNETGTAVYFQPGLLYGGTVQHECSTQRGVGYYLEALVMLGLFCKQPLNATLQGVTNNNIDPSVDLIRTSALSTLKKFFLDDEGLDVKISKRGLLPLGGGEVIFKCPVRKHLRPIHSLDSGMVKRIRGTAFALRVSPAIANRIVDKAKGVLLNFLPDIYINTDQCRGKQSGKSPGFGIHLTAETTNGVIYSSEQVSNVVSNGEDPSVPEDVGVAAAQRLLHEIYLGGATDSTCQSVAILCMALGQQDVSKFVTGPLTENAIGFLRHLKEFFGVTFKLEHYEPDEESPGTGSQKVMLTCVGLGYTNISKRTI